MLDFYTPFKTERTKGDYTKYWNDTHEISPEDGMGDPTNTNYMRFDKACSQSISNDMKRDFEKLLKDTPYVNSYSEVLREARKENKRCYDELSTKVEDIRQALITAVKSAKPGSKSLGSYKNLLKMEYMEILTQKLLTYWATNRFTPNANMPVNIMSLDLNATKLKSKNDVKRGVSNPSYTLRQAIQQYVPGNSIVVDGVVYIVRGLTTQDAYNSGRTIKKLFRNANKTELKKGDIYDMSIAEISIYGKFDKDGPLDVECHFHVETMSGEMHDLEYVFKDTVKLGDKISLTLTGNAKDGYILK